MADLKETGIVNRVAASGLKTIKLESFIPQVEMFDFDLKDYLFKGLLLREKDFRSSMKSFDWQSTKDKVLCLFCSSDAIIPRWAYMLITKHAYSYVSDLYFGTSKDYLEKLLVAKLESVDWSTFQDERVILKGCSEGLNIPEAAYIAATKGLLPFAKSIMYGEPCSTVPIFKKPKNK